MIERDENGRETWRMPEKDTKREVVELCEIEGYIS